MINPAAAAVYKAAGDKNSALSFWMTTTGASSRLRDVERLRFNDMERGMAGRDASSGAGGDDLAVLPSTHAGSSNDRSVSTVTSVVSTLGSFLDFFVTQDERALLEVPRDVDMLADGSKRTRSGRSLLVRPRSRRRLTRIGRIQERLELREVVEASAALLSLRCKRRNDADAGLHSIVTDDDTNTRK